MSPFKCSIRNIQKSFLLPFLCAGFIFRCLLEITSNWNEIYKKIVSILSWLFFPPFFHSSTWEKVKKKLKKNEMKYKKFFSFIKLSTFLYISPPDVIVLVAIRTWWSVCVLFLNSCYFIWFGVVPTSSVLANLLSRSHRNNLYKVKKLFKFKVHDQSQKQVWKRVNGFCPVYKNRALN